MSGNIHKTAPPHAGSTAYINARIVDPTSDSEYRGAVLISGLALAAIVLAAGLIYWLDSPEGEARRVRMKRALPSLLDEPKQNNLKPLRPSR